VGDRYLERNFADVARRHARRRRHRHYNITNPALPAQVINFSAPGVLHVRGVTYLTSSNWAVIWGT